MKSMFLITLVKSMGGCLCMCVCERECEKVDNNSSASSGKSVSNHISHICVEGGEDGR